MFRLAETLRIADPQMIEEKLPQSLINDWLRYFEQKDDRFDKLEYYLVQLSGLIGSIVGTDPKTLVYPRDGEKRARGRRRRKAAASEPLPTEVADGDDGEKNKITPQVAETLLRLAFGV